MEIPRERFIIIVLFHKMIYYNFEETCYKY